MSNGSSSSAISEVDEGLEHSQLIQSGGTCGYVVTSKQNRFDRSELGVNFKHCRRGATTVCRATFDAAYRESNDKSLTKIPVDKWRFRQIVAVGSRIDVMMSCHDLLC